MSSRSGHWPNSCRFRTTTRTTSCRRDRRLGLLAAFTFPGSSRSVRRGHRRIVSAAGHRHTDLARLPGTQPYGEDRGASSSCCTSPTSASTVRTLGPAAQPADARCARRRPGYRLAVADYVLRRRCLAHRTRPRHRVIYLSSANTSEVYRARLGSSSDSRDIRRLLPTSAGAVAVVGLRLHLCKVWRGPKPHLIERSQQKHVIPTTGRSTYGTRDRRTGNRA